MAHYLPWGKIQNETGYLSIHSKQWQTVYILEVWLIQRNDTNTPTNWQTMNSPYWTMDWSMWCCPSTVLEVLSCRLNTNYSNKLINISANFPFYFIHKHVPCTCLAFSPRQTSVNIHEKHILSIPVHAA